MIEFEGTLSDEASFGSLTEVRGRYRWIDAGSPVARVAGEIVVSRGGPSDVFSNWGGVNSFRGRTCRLAIGGVGLSPVRIHSDGRARDDGTTPIAFEAWLPPVPIADRRELADALRTPIADALEQAGLAELAGLARAAAVALFGFPRPSGKGGAAGGP